MMRGLLPMRLSVPPQAGALGVVLVQQMPMHPASAACHPNAPHPVVGVLDGHKADAVLPGQGDGPAHHQGGVDVAQPHPAVPPLHGAKGGEEDRPCRPVHQPPVQVVHRPGEAVHPVAVNAVQAVIGVVFGRRGGVFRRDPVGDEDLLQGLLQLFVGDIHDKNSFLSIRAYSRARAISPAAGGQPFTWRAAWPQQLPMPRPSKALPRHPWPMAIGWRLPPAVWRARTRAA